MHAVTSVFSILFYSNFNKNSELVLWYMLFLPIPMLEKSIFLCRIYVGSYVGVIFVDIMCSTHFWVWTHHEVSTIVRCANMERRNKYNIVRSLIFFHQRLFFDAGCPLLPPRWRHRRQVEYVPLV